MSLQTEQTQSGKRGTSSRRGPIGPTRAAASQQRNSDGSGSNGGGDDSTPPNPPISLPKGGGAIHGLGEKFDVNLTAGTGLLTVPVPTSALRGDRQPTLSLSYSS